MEAGAEEIDSDQEGQQDESEGEDFFQPKAAKEDDHSEASDEESSTQGGVKKME